MPLHPYLVENGFTDFEGSIQQVQAQMEVFRTFLRETYKPSTVLEIGFNAGHSAEVILHYSDRTSLLSFDLGDHDYVTCGKKYIDMTFPNRHELILGDSRKTVPEFIRANPHKKYDMIFIDGGHEFETAYADLINCREAAHRDTIVIMDDTMYLEDGRPADVGPTNAWLKGIADGLIQEEPNGRKMFDHYRGMSYGKYVF